MAQTTNESTLKRIVVAITGASGAVYGVRILEMLRDAPDIETHLVVSKAGHLTLAAECYLKISDVAKLADVVHVPNNIGASISSGSFRADGMIIVPCTTSTAAKIATGITEDLISRAADVMLKERRTLVIAIRENPLHAGHLETLLKLSRLGAIIFPPTPSFYHQPKSIQDLVDQSCMRMLDQLDIRLESAPRWGENGGVVAFGDKQAESLK
jgi:4-hydroxy-3-polyprenylbenzoate decarboxylase